jgi:hypothetical protein
MQTGGRDDGIGEKAIAWGSDLIKMTLRKELQPNVWFGMKLRFRVTEIQRQAMSRKSDGSLRMIRLLRLDWRAHDAISRHGNH